MITLTQTHTDGSDYVFLPQPQGRGGGGPMGTAPQPSFISPREIHLNVKDGALLWVGSSQATRHADRGLSKPLIAPIMSIEKLQENYFWQSQKLPFTMWDIALMSKQHNFLLRSRYYHVIPSIKMTRQLTRVVNCKAI